MISFTHELLECLSIVLASTMDSMQLENTISKLGQFFAGLTPKVGIYLHSYYYGYTVSKALSKIDFFDFKTPRNISFLTVLKILFSVTKEIHSDPKLPIPHSHNQRLITLACNYLKM